MGLYVKNSEEDLLKGVKATDVIEYEQRVERRSSRRLCIRRS